MKERSSFHESYYDHSCSIVPEQDVLQTDIIGKGGFTNLKRWWNGLFLLSYSDKRSRVYYTSSHTIRIDRIKQYRRYKDRIHPLSKFRNIWDCLLVWVLTVNQVIFHHNSSLIFGHHSSALYYTCVVLEFFVILDLFINFKTGYIDKNTKQIILDTNRGRIQYCSTKLFLHCASAMPLQIIMFFRYGNNVNCIKCKANRFICVLRLLSLFRLKRIYEASEYWTRDRGSFLVTHFFCLFRIIVLGFNTMLHYIDLCDTISLWVMIMTNHIDETSYYGKLTKMKFGTANPQSDYYFIYHEFSRISNSLLLFSFGLRQIAEVDQMLSLIAYVIASAFYIWTLLECYTLISRMKFPEDRVLLNQAMAMNLAKSRQLPDDLGSKLMRYHDLKKTKTELIEKHNGLFKCLPMILKKEALLSCYMRHVARVSYFSDWPQNLIEELVFLLEVENFLQGDIIAEAWSQGDGLIIIYIGVMAVYSPENEEMGHLIDGDYFGELSLVTDKEVRTSSVVAVTSCKVLLLPKSSFRKLMRNYTYQFFKMKRQLQDTYSSLTSSRTLSKPIGSDSQTDEAAKPDETKTSEPQK